MSTPISELDADTLTLNPEIPSNLVKKTSALNLYVQFLATYTVDTTKDREILTPYITDLESLFKQLIDTTDRMNTQLAFLQSKISNLRNILKLPPLPILPEALTHEI